MSYRVDWIARLGPILTGALCAALCSSNCSALRRDGPEDIARAEAAFRAGDYEAARGGFEPAIAGGRDAERARAGLLRVLFETGRFAEAGKLADGFLSARPSATLLLEAGRIAVAVGDSQRAEAFLRRSLELSGPNRWAAARELADLLESTGRRTEAVGLWEGIIKDYREGRLRSSEALGCAAVAAWRLDYARDAKNLFLDATGEQGGSASLRSLEDFGFLFLEKYNATDAIGVFRDCLKINKAYPPALLGLAQAKRYESSAEVEISARAALEANPNYVPAICLLAELRIEEEHYDAAEAEVRRALAVNPNSLEALSLLAVCRQLRGDSGGFSGAERRILELNPTYGRFYHTLAENLVRQRKYREAVEQERQALRLDEGLWAAHAGLGMNLMRLGDLAQGRISLQKAFEGDPFNVWAYNTLDLLDQMDKFVRATSDHFVYLAAKEDEASVLPYGKALAEEAYAKLTARYRFTPKGPIQIEFFPDEGGFAVRTLGLPGLGALGVCFGGVIAQDSPRARKIGSFNWGSTLWHEFAHVITLQMTNHNIPRWYSEGISVFEERRARPGWGDDLTPAFVQAFKEKKLLKVSELNAGMMRPRFPEQIALSYYQASLVCELIEERFGFEKIRESLAAFASGDSAERVFHRVLGWDPDAMDREYARFLDRRVGELAARVNLDPSGKAAEIGDRAALAAAVAKSPDDFLANLRLGALLWKEQSWTEAERYLKKAQRLFPEHVEQGGAYKLLYEIYEAQKREDEALAQLTAWVSYDENALFPLVRASEICRRRRDWASAARMLEAASYIHPYDAYVQRMLAETAAEAGDWRSAASAYQVLLSLNPPDRAGAHYGLARALLALGRLPEAKRATLRALEIAPTYEPALQLLLELRGARP